MSRPVVRVGDFILPHVCPTGGLHSTPFITGSLSVLTNSKPTVTFGSFSLCGVMAIPIHNSILVNGKPIAVSGSPTTKHLPRTLDPATGKLALSVTKTTVPGTLSPGQVGPPAPTEITEVVFADCFPPTFCAMGSLSVLANVKGA